jgi:allophanate hydrolase subunit 2
VSEALFEVLDGGLMTTIQDAGRPDWTHLGVPVGGAADPWSLAVANLLVGNEPGSAVLEMTLVGPTLAVHAGAAVTIGLAGADLGARIRNGRRLAPGRSHRLAGGDILDIPGDRTGPSARGSRAYLAVPGGIDVPVVLGSRSTCLAGGFGGLDGRPLRTGDRIAARGRAGAGVREGAGEGAGVRAGAGGSARSGSGRAVVAARSEPELVWPDGGSVGDRAASGASGIDAVAMRVIAGPAPGLEALAASDWRVGSAADRVGVRLEGGSIPDGIGGDGRTLGVPWGAIQLPPDGRPIILGVDHQTTGGYRVVGVVISADLPILGQLRPGDPVRLVATDRAAALEALRGRREACVAGAAALRDAAGWGTLIDSAGG